MEVQNDEFMEVADDIPEQDNAAEETGHLESQDGFVVKRMRPFTFTMNNPTEDQRDYLVHIAFTFVPSQITYFCFGYEVGAEGTPHFQGFVYFKNKKSYRQVHEFFPGCHIIGAKGNARQNRTYCSKDCTSPELLNQNFFEYGDIPADAQSRGLAEQDRWRRAIALSKADKLDEIAVLYPDIYGRCFNNMRSIRDDARHMPKENVSMANLWIYGPPGTGKSKYARELYPEAYIKEPTNFWWTGYTGQDDVIIDDFDKYQKSQGGDMKRWMDHYPFQARVHGSQFLIRPKRIIVTSNYHPSDIWSDPITVAAILRRCDLVLKDDPENPYQPQAPMSFSSNFNH